MLRETWAMILNNYKEFKVVGLCGSGEEGVQLAKDLKPKLILMDINLGGMNGVEATRQIRKYSPGSKILGVSLHAQPIYARNMLLAGASGYVTKGSHHQELITALKQLLLGKKYICSEIKDALSDLLLEGQPKTGINSLSKREIVIIDQIKVGNSSKEIAMQLGISVKTVGAHRHNILKKLGLKNSVALVHYINNTELSIS
jgi:DNA-binding NarL/FixJ family response regulator